MFLQQGCIELQLKRNESNEETHKRCPKNLDHYSFMTVYQFSRFIRRVLLQIFVEFKQSEHLVLFYDEYGDYALDARYQVDYAVTLGVGNNVAFEKWLKTRYPEVQITLVDPIIEVDFDECIKREKLIVSQADRDVRYARRKLDDNSYRYFPDITGEFSGITLGDCFEGNEVNILIKFDIEGFEFIILKDLLRLVNIMPVNQISCELHWNWYEIISVVKVIRFFARLKKCGFYPVWKSDLGKEFLLVKM